jgi:CBS domain-containing protein
MFDTENLAYAIVTDDKPLIGIVTETDLCSYYSRKSPHRFRVSDFMSRDFIFAKSSYPVLHVAHAIVFRQPSVPVIDEELVGILTLSDLLTIKDKGLAPSRGGLSFASKAETDSALIRTKDLMTLSPITTFEDTDLAQAGQIIIGKGIASLPVVDHKARVVGLLTKHDIVIALGRVGTSKILEA